MVPTYDKFIDPLLRVLSELPNDLGASEAFERVAAGARTACTHVATATTKAAINRPIANRELQIANVKVSPTFFETIVLDLLHKMGYGTDRTDLQRVGGSGDGGIDGIIYLDKLGLEKVYVQAKRWQQNVGRSPFLLTLMQRSTATSWRHFRLPRPPRLTRLIPIDHEKGISRKAVYVPKLDSDYFGE